MLIRSLFLLGWVLVAPLCFADDIYIRLKPKVTVNHLNISLKEIATVTVNSSNPAMLDRLILKPVVHLSSLVNPVKLTRQQIENSLTQAGLKDAAVISWGGVDSILIYGKSQVVDLSPWMRSVADSMSQKNGTQTDFKLMNVYESVEVPMGKVEPRANLEKVRRYGDEIQIPFSIFVDGKLSATRTAHLKMQATNLLTGDALNRNKDLQKVSSAQLPYMPGSSDQLVELSSNEQNKSFLIKKNQHVRILVQDAAVEIESEGVSLSSANVGDEIKVRRMSSQDVLIGRAIEPNVVVVGGL